MLLRLLYDEKLAQASYVVGCQRTGEALVIDPNRDCDQYIALADREGFKITGVTETHIHADYLSGSRELAARTGATLYLSGEGTADWKYGYDDGNVELVHDGDTFKTGNVRLEVMHTPGHTPEHISFILTDFEADQPMGIFSGDFVFVGDVGRPDLLETAAGVSGTMEPGARTLYQSLQRFKQLPDHLQLWPGHGAGSACGKALGAVPQSTVGYEKLFNWALNVASEDEFVAEVLSGQPEPPYYFAMMKHMNKVGPALAEGLTLPSRMPAPDIQAALERGMTIVDTRPNDAFAGAHIPGTINIGHSKGYLTTAGWLISYDEPFGLIVDAEKMEQTVKDLRLIGLDDVYGYWTPDVIEAWSHSGHKLGSTPLVNARVVENALAGGTATVLDVRGTGEYLAGHIPGAQSLPLGYISRRLAEIPADRPIIVHCQTGVRSAVASSVLQSLGRTDVSNYTGSYEDWSLSGHPVESEAEEAKAVLA